MPVPGSGLRPRGDVWDVHYGCIRTILHPCADAGLAFVQYPEGKGGLGVAPGMQAAVERTIRASGRAFHPLAVNTIGIGMGLPTVLTYGSDEHHEKHLKRIFAVKLWIDCRRALFRW